MKGRREDAIGARLINAMLGLWLFLSSFLWSHSHAQLLNAWIVGIGAVTFALAALAGSTGRATSTPRSAPGCSFHAAAAAVGAVTSFNQLLVGFGLVLFGLSLTVRAARRGPIEPR